MSRRPEYFTIRQQVIGWDMRMRGSGLGKSGFATKLKGCTFLMLALYQGTTLVVP
jgi:hypothetical protein